MQNLDFRGRLPGSSPSSSRERLPGENRARPAGGAGGKLSRGNLLYGLLIAVIIAFTLGLLAGVRLGKYQSLEDNIVKKSARKPGTVSVRKPTERGRKNSSFMNVPSRARNGNGALKNYVVIIGSYSPANARKLLLGLSTLPDLKTIPPSACKSLEETVPNRGLGFRLKSPGRTGLQRVYLGCFTDMNLARRAHRIARNYPGLRARDVKLIELK